MLEGLDAIDWKGLSDRYSLTTPFPVIFRQMLSDHIGKRRSAQHQIQDTLAPDNLQLTTALTPAAVPFIIELLAAENTPDPEELMNILRLIIRRSSQLLSSGAKIYINEPWLLHIPPAYHAISAGYPVYQRYLGHASEDVRLSALKLIMQLPEQLINVRPALAERVSKEQNPVILASVLEAFSQTVANKQKSADNHKKSAYVKAIRDFLSPEHDRLVRVAAAGAWLNANRTDFIRGPQDLPVTLVPVLLEAIQTPIDILTYRGFPLLPDDLMFISAYVLYARITWTGVDRSIEALNSPLLTPLQVHYLAREMLERVFNRRTTVIPAPGEPPYWRWQYFGGWLNYAHPPNNLRYKKALPEQTNPYAPPPERDERDYRPGGWLMPWQYKVIQGIVDCDAFWQISTNLFSYFYGLPDDRDALRALRSR